MPPNITPETLEKLKKRFTKQRHNNSTSKPHQSDSIADLDQEPQEEYTHGGYCPVQVNKLYGPQSRYRIIQKLGWGCFSTVWLAYDYEENQFVAVKFQKANQAAREAALDEMRIGNALSNPDRSQSAIVQLYNHFDTMSENGKHLTMVFELVGENLLSLIRSQRYKPLPLPLVKKFAKDILCALKQMHEAQVIHTDLKPENILLTVLPSTTQKIVSSYTPPPKAGVPLLERTDLSTLTKAQRKRLRKKQQKLKEQQQLDGNGNKQDGNDSNHNGSDNKQDGNDKTDSEVRPTPIRTLSKSQHLVKIADLGNACWVHEHFTDDIQTRQYRSPEVILQSGYDPSCDVWSAACVIFELITGDFLFQPKSSRRGTYSRSEDHLALMMEYLGDFSLRQIRSGRHCSKYFTSKGKLKHIHDLRRDSIAHVLEKRYKFSSQDAKQVEEFLLPMLALDPSDRASAKQCLEHSWLQDVDDTMRLSDDMLDTLNMWVESPELRAQWEREDEENGGEEESEAEE